VKRDLTLPNNTSIKIEGNKMIIEGGTQVGQNLFHSFQEFSLSKENVANFNNALDIANIIVRVTGGSASNIDGIISANGTANLFFSNPNGISFGQNARLNIGGSFVATTASAFTFGNGSEFSATNPQAPPLLAINVPIGLRFGSNSGAIQVNGTGQGLISEGIAVSPSVSNSNTVGLQVLSGKTLGLVGGDINIEGGTLTAEEGQIELGSVSSGVVGINSLDQKPFLDYGSISSFKDLNISQTALVNTSGNIGGSISLHGKNISVSDGSVLLVQNLGSQLWGGIQVHATEALKLNGTSPNGKFFSTLRTESIGTGSGGDVNVFTKGLTLEAGAAIGSTTYSSVKGGNINVDTDSMQLINYAALNPYTTTGIIVNTAFSGDTGDIKILTRQLLLKDGGLITSLTLGTGNAGNIFINATDSVELINSEALINLERFYVPSYIATQAFTSGKAGNLTINTLRALVGDKASVDTSTYGFGDGGTIIINASDLKISGSVNSSALKASSDIQRFFRSPSTPSGSSGEVNISTKTLEVLSGGEIAVKNKGTGNAGTLTINAGSINLNNDGAIAASTASGEGGNISLEARSVQLRDNSFITATAQSGQGNGGNINIKSGTVVLLEDSRITANAFEGRGGNINIDTQGLFVSPNSSITASSAKGVNGIVTVNTGEMNFVNTVALKTGFNNNDTSKFCADSESREQLQIAGSGGIPASPSDSFNSLDGWSDDRKPNTNTTQSETNTSSTQNLVAPEYIEAQGSISNNDGTISFTDVPSDTTPYSSLSSAPCHSSEQSLAPGQQLSGEIIPEPPQKSTEH
jgi:filamentous hemagglutinin family protein